MITKSQWFVWLILVWIAATAQGQTAANTPHIGYLYPTGGCRGTTVIVAVGGQYLKGTTDVCITGDGVQARIIKHMTPIVNINSEQRAMIQDSIKAVRQQRLAELTGETPVPPPAPEVKPAPAAPEPAKITPATPADKKTAMPEHPLLYNLENKSLRELASLTHIILNNRKRQQPNRQIAESVMIEFTIDPAAMPGRRELRLKTPAGLTNPMVFQVGLLPEVQELEPNDQQANPLLPNLSVQLAEKIQGQPFDVPVLLNGQIFPGDVDRWSFRARQGQRLVMAVQARSLIPYLADAVPGWFQPTLTLYDADGKELAFADDYYFSPDPVVCFEAPQDGVYDLAITDSIYRGREDFVYRVSISEQPFVTSIFPLGGRLGEKTEVALQGWNLPQKQLTLDGAGDAAGLYQTAYAADGCQSNPVAYALDALPECLESEPDQKPAQPVSLPIIINGQIGQDGDDDVFRIEGKAGDKIVAEVMARCLNSPLDSLLRLTDATGKTLALNDDYVVKEDYLYKDLVGLSTHHSDSWLQAEMPRDGVYYVHLTDAQHHGGADYGYRLRLSAPRPDFALRITPSSLSIRSGGIMPLCVYVLRQDGFEGEIELSLDHPPAGFELGAGRIPAAAGQAWITLTAPYQTFPQPVSLTVLGQAVAGGQTITRRAAPADDSMQAFLYRHLVPARDLLVQVLTAKGSIPPIQLVGKGPVQLPVGGQAGVQFKTGKRPALQKLELQLFKAPEGLTLDDVAIVNNGVTFTVRADGGATKPYAGNLLVEAFAWSNPSAAKDGKPAVPAKRYSVGLLPAIPIEIVAGEK